MLVKKVETIGLTVAEQLVPTSSGYKTKTLSSGKVDIEVASVNLTQLEQLSLPDNPNRSYEVSSLEQIGRVVIPLEAFASNTSVLGQAVWMMFDPLTAMDDSSEIVVRSRIMNIVVKPHRTQEFERPVEMTFWPSQDIQSNVDCVFWDQGQKNNHGNWSTEGCQVTQRNSSTVTCHCNHLTSFAVLTRVTPHQPSKEHELPLSIITYVGCGLSVLGCLLTILTYSLLPSVRSQRILIHMNLVTALVVAQVLFLVAAFAVSPRTSRVACYVIAVSLLFLLLCVFSWMLAEGLHIYFTVVRVFDSGRTRKLFYLLIGWGFPFIVTVVVVSVFQRGLLSNDLCWLSIETGAIWSFVGPVIFVMLFNLVIVTMVMSVTSRMLNEETPSSVRSLTKAFITLLPILGLTWVFGLLAVNNDSVLFEYIFAILNSLQGFLIFLLYCLKNSEVRREFKRKLHNLRAQRHPSHSSNPNTPRCTPAEIEAPGPCTQQENTTRDKGFETRL
ncbi:adhesion G-protein coupled receptor D1-like [Stylophora pistillata]|uniref:adhesion G-protein coupled receptor D1-like n=1 Tax=Stylophora pistillata TaxID=50429 RepID=UPI000C043488|nr:adhesion G-protein coupled receptor D1-like [Stylophora pistillata]